MEYRIEDATCPLWGSVVAAGNDCTVTVHGGSAPHIGSVVLAVPRPSLTGVGTSATVSCLNRTGHMDDVVAVAVAKRVASIRGGAVACSCGIHIDNASPEIIAHIASLGDQVANEVVRLLQEGEGTHE